MSTPQPQRPAEAAEPTCYCACHSTGPRSPSCSECEPRHATVTPLPWQVLKLGDAYPSVAILAPAVNKWVAKWPTREIAEDELPNAEADAALIVTAVNERPALLAHLAAADRLAAQARKAIDRLDKGVVPLTCCGSWSAAHMDTCAVEMLEEGLAEWEASGATETGHTGTCAYFLTQNGYAPLPCNCKASGAPAAGGEA